MNYDEMTPEKLNAVFCEKVLGYKLGRGTKWVDKFGEEVSPCDVKFYTTELMAVWPFVAACKEWDISKRGDEWECTVFTDRAYAPIHCCASLPFALCVCLIKQAMHIATHGVRE